MKLEKRSERVQNFISNLIDGLALLIIILAMLAGAAILFAMGGTP